MRYTINPYKTPDGRWTFIDPNTNRTEQENELVLGIDVMLETLKKKLGRFSVTFSDEMLPVNADYSMILRWARGDKNNSTQSGNTYIDLQTGEEGWLCSVLFDYFSTAPDFIYLYIHQN